MILLWQETWPQPTYKTSEVFQVYTNSSQAASPGLVGTVWRCTEGVWLLLFFHHVASELENKESSSPNVTFVTINNNKLCPYSLFGSFLRYQVYSYVCFF